MAKSQAERSRDYYQRHKAEIAEKQKAFRKTPKGKAFTAKWSRSPAALEAQRRYRESAKGKASAMRAVAKRRERCRTDPEYRKKLYAGYTERLIRELEEPLPLAEELFEVTNPEFEE